MPPINYLNIYSITLTSAAPSIDFPAYLPILKASIQ